MVALKYGSFYWECSCKEPELGGSFGGCEEDCGGNASGGDYASQEIVG
jgi:hypothetical protein